MGGGSPEPGTGQLTTGADRRGEAGELPGRGEQHAALPGGFPGEPAAAQQAAGRDPEPLGTPTRARAAFRSPRCPPGVSGAAGLPWAPVGQPRHGGCAPRLSGGRGRSHGLSSHAALGPGPIPPHTAPRAPPRRPSPSFAAVQAPTLHTDLPTRAHKAAGLAR